jgi:hypothetical protein
VEMSCENWAVTRVLMFLCRSVRIICGRLSNGLPIEPSSLGSALQYVLLFRLSVCIMRSVCVGRLLSASPDARYVYKFNRFVF